MQHAAAGTWQPLGHGRHGEWLGLLVSASLIHCPHSLCKMQSGASIQSLQASAGKGPYPKGLCMGADGFADGAFPAADGQPVHRPQQPVRYDCQDGL